ncbi:hypothetical protein HJ588_11200 [Flexivirga sp. ID2601S]|uniref:Uncharacterized protein n=1 Tax=Flexivirga aerilata TaxID=1656889 RepID=A0A849AKN6_9MICO|nr:hypothetical protein [Flexivirga aerilata]NNG39838.1 hypothetical protein [Flexivirga aerilata]
MTFERRDEPDEQTDYDRRFAEIIAQFEPDESVWEEPAKPADGSAAPEPTSQPEPASSPLADLPSQWRIPAGESVSFIEDDGDYEPPPPRPLPTGDDLGFWTMVGCLVGGPLWLLYLFVFDRYAQSLWWVLACTLFVAGVVQLIMREPKNRDDLDEDDDGAVL